MAERKGYSIVQIALHWVIAVLIIGAFTTREAMEEVQEALEAGQALDALPTHTVLGGLVFALVLARLVIRLTRGAPEPDDDMPAWNKTAAIWGHRLLYALMIAVPALGAAVWYLGIEAAAELHETLGQALLIVALGHALVAIAHHARDGRTLTRMVRPGE